jgi:hypothetical protein
VPIKLAPALLFAVPGSLIVALPSASSANFSALNLVGNAGCLAALLGPAAFYLSNRGLGTLKPALFGAAIAAGPLLVLAAVLKNGTHHRPLGAVTFTIVGGLLLLSLVGGAYALGRRLPTSVTASRLPTALAGLVLIGSLLSGWLLAPGHSSALPGLTLSGVLAVAMLFSFTKLSTARGLDSIKWLGPALWTVWVLVGMALAFR